MASYSRTPTGRFFGWRVVGAAFVLGFFGWGVAFYGPPVFLSVIRESRGWPIPLISTAVTAHFLIGALVGGNLPRLYACFGAATVTKTGVLCMATGLLGWALAAEPWQLFAAAVFSGVGWGTMSAAALNAFVSPWFVRSRPAALGMAYNGGSVGGIVFSPLWVAAIGLLGFPMTALVVGAVMAVTIWVLTDLVLSKTPESLGLHPDGDVPGVLVPAVPQSSLRPLPGSLLWRDRRFLTLAAGMALGLFAQIGLIAHLYSLLVPAIGAQEAGLAMGSITAMAIAGRMFLGWFMKPGTDRRLAASCGYAAQLAGSVVFFCAAGTDVPLLLIGIVLFGVGFGNATSLPPLIAQVEFARRDVPRAVALIVAVAQGSFAFAPAVFSLIREITPISDSVAPGASPLLFATAAGIQGLAIAAFLAGRGR
jgi:MFS family permease